MILDKKKDICKLTVNSSLNAVPSYKRLGFKIKAKEKCYNGIRFIPMELAL